MNDIKHALRQIAHRPGGTIVILATLSLVIGSMGLVLGILQGEHSRWLPFPNSDRVVRIWLVGPDHHQDQVPLQAIRQTHEQLSGFEAIGVMGHFNSEVLTGEGEPRTLSTLGVSAGVFDVAGVPCALGRPFTAEEVHSGTTGIAVISHELWTEQFESDPKILGREFTLNQTTREIIGVMAPGMADNALFYGTDVWLPKDFFTNTEGDHYFKMIGRRKAEVNAAQLNAELKSVFTPIMNNTTLNNGGSGTNTAMAFRADKLPGSHLDGEHVIGVSIPVLVLGIAAFNVANVLLARMLTRRHEFAVRFSLGANRRRLIRQLLTESIVLAILSAAAGLVVAFWVGEWARTVGMRFEITPTVIIGTTLFAVVTGLVVGLLPALRATKGDFSSDLKEASIAAVGGTRRRHRLRNSLVIGQVCMATVLCISAGLLLRSQVEKRKFEPGFDPTKLLHISSSIDDKLMPEPERRSLYAESVMQELQGIPGVLDVSFVSDGVVNRNPFHTSFRLPDHEGWQSMGLTVISPNHLPMLNVPLKRGRWLEESDRRGNPVVMIVNESFAHRYFPNQDAIGEEFSFRIEGEPTWVTIVGVVADRVNLGRQRELGPEGYLSIRQAAPIWLRPRFIISTATQSSGLAKTIRNTVKAVNSNTPVSHVGTVTGAIERAIAFNQGSIRAITGVGLFGLLIAMLGIYGVVAYSVTERRQELGIRIALGASQLGVLRLILRQGLGYVVVGLAAGTVLAILITQAMHEMIYGISPWDGLTYLVVGSILVGAAALATIVPAWRATQIDPAHSLRYE